MHDEITKNACFVGMVIEPIVAMSALQTTCIKL